MFLLNIRFVHFYKVITLLASVLLITGFCIPCYAVVDEDEYHIDGIVADADGKDANDARTKALAQAEIDAFRQYATKREPTKAIDVLAKLTPLDINHLVSGYEVLEEKIVPGHYHATLRYTFYPQPITNLLPEIEPAKLTDGQNTVHSKAVLVLPVYKEGGTLKLWQDDNKWRNVWYEAALESGGGLVVTSPGELDDRVDVDDTNVENATAASLSHMYGRYGVGEIYVLFAYFNKKADPKPTLEVTLKRLLPKADETSHLDYIIRSTETLDTLIARAANDIAERLYKMQTINPNKIEFDRLKEINARINITDIHEWEDLRKRLLTHGNIVSIKFTSVSFYETNMTITFKGSPEILGKTLVASGLRVLQDGDNLVLVPQ